MKQLTHEEYIYNRFKEILNEYSTLKDVMEEIKTFMTNDKEVDQFLTESVYECYVTNGYCYYIHVAWNDLDGSLYLMGEDYIERKEENVD